MAMSNTAAARTGKLGPASSHEPAGHLGDLGRALAGRPKIVLHTAIHECHGFMDKVHDRFASAVGPWQMGPGRGSRSLPVRGDLVV